MRIVWKTEYNFPFIYRASPENICNHYVLELSRKCHDICEYFGYENLSFLKILKWALIKIDWWKFTFTKIIFQVEFSMVMRYNLGYITVKGWWYNLAPFWITSLFTPKDFSISVLRFNSFNITGLFPFPLEKWESLWFSK